MHSNFKKIMSLSKRLGYSNNQFELNCKHVKRSVLGFKMASESEKCEWCNNTRANSLYNLKKIFNSNSCPVKWNGSSKY